MNLFTATPADFCAATDACSGGRDWAITQPTMADVWDHCPRADWLLWILDRLDQRPDDRTLRMFAVWCARSTPLDDGRVTGDLLTDPRSLAALEVAERYANGMATPEELYAAWDAAWAASLNAAWDAAGTADAARDAARDAAWDAARNAAWAARAAAGDTAWDAAWDAAWNASLNAAWDAAWDAASIAQANQFRRVVPNPFRAKEGQP